MPTYVIKMDDAFAIEQLERFRTQRFRIGRIGVKVICGIGLAALGALGLAIDIFPITAFAVTMIALLLGGHHVDYFFLKRTMRKSPFYQGTMRLVLSDEGLQVTSAHSTSSLALTAFTRSLRMQDGFLLFIGPEAHWWPDSALVDGSVEEVARVLQKVGPREQAK